MTMNDAPDPIDEMLSTEESEQRFRALVELSPDAIVVVFEGIILYVNEAALALVCAPDRESVLGRPFLNFVPEEFRPLISVRIEHSFTSKRRQVLGTKSRTLDGQEFYVEAMSVPVPYKGSYALQIVLRNVTEKYRAQAALNETKERYRLLVEHSPEAIVVHCDWILQYVNPAAVRLLNAASAEDLIGRHFLDFVPMEMRDEIFTRSQQLKDENVKHGSLYIAYVSPSGEKLYFESVGAKTTYNGKPATQIVIRDVTERRRAEEELNNSREELRQLAAHLQSAREFERTSIAREIHDELGQDLTGLKMDLALLEDLVIEHLQPPVLTEMIDRITSMSQLLNTTVHSVRKIISELRPVLLDKLGLLAAIEWQAEEFQNRTGITCDCFLTADDRAFGRDSATAVYRIFQESLTNVMRHSGATRVSVTFGKENDMYELEIRDNGRGIGQDSTSKTKSFGLIGMRERALMFNGSVSVEGEPGKGTTVRLTIPESGLSTASDVPPAQESI